MLCSSSITLGLCTTIGLCTQTNKHRSSCVTERIRAILLSLTSDIWTGHWVYWGIYTFFFLGEHNSNALSGSRLFVRLTVCPPLDYISSYSSMTRWTRARLAQWFLQIVVAICVVMQRSMYESVCKKPERISRRLQKKKRNNRNTEKWNNGFITVAFCKCN